MDIHFLFQRALDLIGIVESNLRKAPNLWPPLSRQANVDRVIELKDGTSYTYTVTADHSNSAVMVYLQCGVTSTESLVLTKLFLQILREPTFNILRTQVSVEKVWLKVRQKLVIVVFPQEQLGYIVYSNARVSACEHGVRIVVQTAHSAEYVERRIEAFLASIGVSIIFFRTCQPNCPSIGTREILQLGFHSTNMLSNPSFLYPHSRNVP